MNDQQTVAAVPDDAVEVKSDIGGYANATLHLVIDHAEHARRQAAGMTVATGHGFGGLDHLMSLPEGIPVPLDGLTKEQRTYVRKAPAGVCTVDDGHVTRHAVRPCRIAMASVRYDTTYLTALNSAARFAPFCARQVIVKRLPKRPVDRMADVMEFGFWGIGIVLEHPDGRLETALPAEPHQPKRHTTAAWWFSERAYAAYLKTIEGSL